MNIFVLFLALLLAFIEALPPVIFLNGVAGAVIKARINLTSTVHPQCAKEHDFRTLWLNPADLLPGYLDCFHDNLNVRYDPIRRKYYDKAGVTLDTSVDFGGVEGLEYLDPDLRLFGYFRALIQALLPLGYIPGRNLHGAPFDWRLAADGLAVKPAFPDGRPYLLALKTLVETTVRVNGEKAVLLGHSMGCLVALAFLQGQPPEWKARYIQRLVAVSPPFGGSPAALKAMVSGDTLGYPLDHRIFRPIQAASASSLWLIPQIGLWPTEVLMETPERSYTAADYEGLFAALGLAQARALYLAGVHNLTVQAFTPPGVPVDVAHGVGVKTECRFRYPEKFEPGRMPPTPHIEFEPDGDGTVPLRSLRRAEQWLGLQRFPVRYTPFPGESHYGLLQSPAFVGHLLALLGGA